MPQSSRQIARIVATGALPIRRGLGWALGVGLLTLAGPGASLAAAVVGFVAAVEGEVDLLRVDEAAWNSAAIDEEIGIGDTLRTGFDSAVKVVLVDDTILGLGEDTELEIDSFVIGPEALTRASVLRQLRGQVRTRVGEAFGGTTRIEVHTPTAIMGVKGTEGTTRVDGGPKTQRPQAPAGSTAGEEEELSTLVRNWEGGITAAMLDGIPLPVPPRQCRIVYLDRVGEPEDCPGDFTPIAIESVVTTAPAELQSDLLLGDRPPAVSAALGGTGVREAVGESLLIEPPDPVIEDRAEADAIAGIEFNPLADFDFDAGEVGSDSGSNPLDDLDFDAGEVGSDTTTPP